MKYRIIPFCLAAVMPALFWPPTISGADAGKPILVASTRNTPATTENSAPAEVFDGMRESFIADKAAGVNAIYQFKLSGPAGGDWWIVVTGRTFRMGRGTIGRPDVTFESSDEDWVRLSNGTLGGVWAFLSGRLKIIGDQSLARKLHDIFP